MPFEPRTGKVVTTTATPVSKETYDCIDERTQSLPSLERWALCLIVAVGATVAGCAHAENRGATVEIEQAHSDPPRVAGGSLGPPPDESPLRPEIAQVPERTTRPGDPLHRHGDEISVCGELFHTGTRVVLWNDFGGYDAYRPHRHLDEKKANASSQTNPADVARYGTFRRHLPEFVATRVHAHGWCLEDLRQVVQQVVIHYDACGTSERCFEVLHDIRGLSCHFLLDLDGTIYQTLDLKERAWHASSANDRSIGIEIAHIGAEPGSAQQRFSNWYESDEHGPRLRVPSSPRTPSLADMELRPARQELIHGPIHGRELVQYDFTPQQYEALVKLLASICRVLPGVIPEVPRGADQAVRTDVLSDTEQSTFRGFIGHYHLTTDKQDPGPAFDWERVLRGVLEALAE